MFTISNIIRSQLCICILKNYHNWQNKQTLSHSLNIERVSMSGSDSSHSPRRASGSQVMKLSSLHNLIVGLPLRSGQNKRVKVDHVAHIDGARQGRGEAPASRAHSQSLRGIWKVDFVI